MADILLLYSTTDGQTRKICQRLQQVIEQHAHRVTVSSIDDEARLDLSRFDTIVLGASIRYGKHSGKVYDFVRRHQALLEAKANAFFTVNVVARKPEKNRPETNPYMRKFLGKIAWRPRALAVFAGKIDYRLYSLRDRLIIRFIMWITHGPTDRDAAVEFTNWNEVEAFGHVISDMQGSSSSEAGLPHKKA